MVDIFGNDCLTAPNANVQAIQPHLINVPVSAQVTQVTTAESVTA